MARKRKRTNPRRKPATQADIKRSQRKGKREAVIGSIAIPLMAAHDVFGFGPARLERFLNRMMALYSDYEQGLFTMEDANDWMSDYAGIKMVDKGGE